jgi:DNA repair protein RadC
MKKTSRRTVHEALTAYGAHGPQTLPLRSLLLLVLQGRTGRRNVETVARAAAERWPSPFELFAADAHELAEVVGSAPATALVAARELVTRALSGGSDSAVIRTAADVAVVMRPRLATLDREHFFAVLLNTKHQVIDTHLVSIGGLASAPVHPREVFKRAVGRGAAAVIVVHNHPSGDPQPSRDDVMITEQLRAAGRLLGIDLLDHVVIGRNGYSSLRDLRLGFV